MKRLLILATTLVSSMLFMFGGVAQATGTTVTKQYRTYYSYHYTVSVDQGYVTASPYVNTPSSTGGCKLDYKKKANGQILILGWNCLTPGTIKFQTPDFPSCNTQFNVYVDGATAYSDLLRGDCPAPVPSVMVTYDGMTLSFTNPDTIVRSSVKSVVVPSLDTTFSSSDPFTYSTMTNFAGIAPNKYVYFTATIGVTLDPGQTITLTRNL